LCGQGEAAAHDSAVEFDGACTAHTVLASQVGSLEGESLAEEIREVGARSHHVLSWSPVDGDAHWKKIGHGLIS
jgi:hypothetical protein